MQFHRLESYLSCKTWFEGPLLCDSVSNFSNLQAVFKIATYERPSAQQRLRCTPFRLIFCPHKTSNSWRKQLLVFPSTANQIMEYDISIIMTKVWIRKRTFQVHHSFPRTWSTSVIGILDLLWERSFGERIHMYKQCSAKGLECHPMEPIDLIAQVMGNKGRIPD